MADVVNIHTAKSSLSSLVARVKSGEEIVIARAGKPIARMIPYRPSIPVREPGSLRGSIVVHGRLDDPDLDAAIARTFEASLDVSPDR